MAIVERCRVVRAKRMAVPEMVAMASERRNQARRKSITCFSFQADFKVRQKEVREKRM